MSFKPPCVSRDELENQLQQSHILSQQIQLALQYAERAHKDQKRDQGNPYLEEHIYPIAVGIANRHQGDPDLENMVTLGILHDVLEDDPNVLPQDIERDFGKDMVADLFLVTKRPEDNTSKLSQEETRAINANMLLKLERGSRRARIVKMEDRLNNLSSFESADRPKYQRYIEETRNLFIPFAKEFVPEYKVLFEQRLAEF